MATISQLCQHGEVEHPVDDGLVAARQQRGSEEAVKAVMLAVAAMKHIESDGPDTTNDRFAVVCLALKTFFNYWTSLYPDNAEAQAASLYVDLSDDDPYCVMIDSELFSETHIELRLDELPRESDSLFNDYRDVIAPRVYSCWSQSYETVAGDLAGQALPSMGEFVDLIRFLAPSAHSSELVSALDWLLTSDVHFGVAGSNEGPSRRCIEVIDSCQAALQSNISSSQGGTGDTLKRMLIDELQMVVGVTRASATVFFEVGGRQDLRAEEATLATGVNTALLSAVRAIAAEHLSYIRNRMAGRVSQPSEAVAHHREACRMAHLALEMSRSARYAKYMAQNLLDISMLLNSAKCRSLAETAWVDVYAGSYIVGFLSGGSAAFTQLGWSSAVFAETASYSNIPAYSAEPDYLYSGVGAEFLRDADPSFAPDLWAAAVILVQHFKDMNAQAAQLQPDTTLPIFTPTEDPSLLFPLRRQHPVAWLYYLAEALVVEHRGAHPHAGLRGAYKVDLRHRRWLSREVGAAFSIADMHELEASTSPRFPYVTKNLLRPVISPEGRSQSEIALWLNVVNAWGVQELGE